MLDKGLICVTRHSVANRKSAFDDEGEWTKPGYMQMQLDLDIAQMNACISVISSAYHLRETWQQYKVVVVPLASSAAGKCSKGLPPLCLELL